jgi:hypothetical protein
MIGATGFRGTNGKGGSTFLADFESVAWKGKTEEGRSFAREVWIVLDSNVTTNTQVLSAARRLVAKLSSRGAEVHVVGLPQPSNPKTKSLGLDDFRKLNPSATLADLKALELKDDIQSVTLDRAIIKARIESRFFILESGFDIFDKEFGQVVSPHKFEHVAGAIFDFKDSNGKTHSGAKLWLRDPERLTFKSLVLDPGETPVGCWNLFKGFAINQPIRGDISWWSELLGCVLPDKRARDEFERILLGPLAHPSEWKTHQTIVIIGSNGIGKDQIGEVVCRIIGDRHVAASQTKT